LKKYLLVLFAWSLALTACQNDGSSPVRPGDPNPPPPMPTLDPDAVALGQQVYAQYCAACHGANLEGEADWQSQNEDRSFRAPPHDADGHTWHHSDEVLVEAIQLGGARLPDNIGGTSNMPAYDDILTDEEILAVLAYIKRSWPDNIRQIQWEATIRE
jgi:S-disulfanyl-L-cysteine oxidoreductase SoxD